MVEETPEVIDPVIDASIEDQNLVSQEGEGSQSVVVNVETPTEPAATEEEIREEIAEEEREEQVERDQWQEIDRLATNLAEVQATLQEVLTRLSPNQEQESQANPEPIAEASLGAEVPNPLEPVVSEEPASKSKPTKRWVF